jgi:hypothetical protein
VEDWKNGTLEYCKVGKSEHDSIIPKPVSFLCLLLLEGIECQKRIHCLLST